MERWELPIAYAACAVSVLSAVVAVSVVLWSFLR